VLSEVAASLSEFTSREKVEEFMTSFNICPDSMDEYISAK